MQRTATGDGTSSFPLPARAPTCSRNIGSESFQAPAPSESSRAFGASKGGMCLSFPFSLPPFHKAARGGCRDPLSFSMEEVSWEPVLLHGKLDIWIYEARSLPNMDLFWKRLHCCFRPCRAVIRRGRPPREGEEMVDSPRRDLRDTGRKITSDPYVIVRVGGSTIACTRVINNAEFPLWNQHFVVPVAHITITVEFIIKDKDVIGADLIGTVDFAATRVASGKKIMGWFPIIAPSGMNQEREPELKISLHYTPVEHDPLYQDGIASDRYRLGVRGTYFPVRNGGRITLYQDAHVNEEDLPIIELEDGKVFQHSNCWEDICLAILEARHLIYIAGWSIYHRVKLVREPRIPFPKAGLELTLGELLKYKSQEGVRVCLLVWDDRTSHDTFPFRTRGVMQTHDEETRKFFEHSSVICVLSPRYASSKLSLIKRQVVGNLYSHHQKCVLVDAKASPSNRKIIAFIGGLDLCDGRYDTPQHRLFCDLDSVFLNDFHNPTFPEETGGPRQPWHDLHCKIEGPAAYDVLKNFEQRWAKATKWWKFRYRFKSGSRYKDDALIKLERVSWILSPSSTVPDNDSTLWVSTEEDTENWHVQVFRSIGSDSVKGFPRSFHEAEKQNLTCKKNLRIDMSIHAAYVEAIRSAQHFIYIENQYFIGSSYGWPSYPSPGADNLIPMELALKIVRKIRAEERFAVYIVMPMWPEGNPHSVSVQEILFWQGQTMEMMYGIIGEELKFVESKQHPEDYLNFYCLGNVEREVTSQASCQNSKDNASASSLKIGQFMIYVHSKGMIVDDEYLILGSANLNQRSLDGSRDTEIAIGAYQPHHTWAKKKRHPLGQVYGYRMSLWAEHLNDIRDCFKEPHTIECVSCVNEIAKTNWRIYMSNEMTKLQGHLLKYPVMVGADGKVGPLDGCEEFPNVGGKILGEPSAIPDLLTM